jgi:hypothetical protein
MVAKSHLVILFIMYSHYNVALGNFKPILFTSKKALLAYGQLIRYPYTGHLEKEVFSIWVLL